MLSDAYIAGFFDGEGCIHARALKADLQISIAQKVPGPLPLIAVQFGGTVRRQSTGMYTWACPAASETLFLVAVMPYLHVKRAQAEVALEWLRWGQRGWSTPRTKAARRERQEYNSKRFAARRLLETQLRHLKTVGRLC